MTHRRKTGFFGFVMSVNSVLMLADDLLHRSVNPFGYFLTYKLSQDHFELFFSKVRSRGGFNNNPSVLQFQAAFRSLVLKNCITPSLNANCSTLDCDDGYISIRRKVRHPDVDNTAEGRDDIVVETYVNAVCQSKFVGSCLYYIGGFVARTVANHLSCEDCTLALYDCVLDSPDPAVCGLVKCKDRGGLKRVSGSVYRIISVAETVVNREIICLGKLPSTSKLRLSLLCKVLDILADVNSFPLFDSHFASSVFLRRFAFHSAHQINC
jgi:hypothetical protein